MHSSRDFRAATARIAFSHYSTTEHATPAATTTAQEVEEDGSDFAMPNSLAYALGWLVASTIVTARYHDSALDAIPIFHPEHGWDRFLLTRRVSCNLLAEEAANAFGMIELAPSDAPRITDPDGNVMLSLADPLRMNAEDALAEVLTLFPAVGLVQGDHATCSHSRARQYPLLYRTVADLIAEHPGLIAARELHIDDGLVDGAYHPLFLFTGGRQATPSYDWFALEHFTTRYVAFLRINGQQSVYRTDRGTWASPRTHLAAESEAAVRRRLLAWLRLDGRPDELTVD